MAIDAMRQALLLDPPAINRAPLVQLFQGPDYFESDFAGRLCGKNRLRQGHERVRMDSGSQAGHFLHDCDRLTHILRLLAWQTENEVDDHLVAEFSRQGHSTQDTLDGVGAVASLQHTLAPGLGADHNLIIIRKASQQFERLRDDMFRSNLRRVVAEDDAARLR